MDNENLVVQEEEVVNIEKDQNEKRASRSLLNWILFIASCVVSVVLLKMFFSAADSVKTGGLEIMSIESVGGRTLEEAYYHGLGYVYEGYCVVIRAIGVFCAAILLLFGASRLKNVKK